MTKLEQVIKALQLCRYDPDPGQECKFLVSCDICPYWNDEVGCREIDLFNDALELLKEREPVKPIDETYWNHTYGRCGHCKAPLPALEGLKSKFCWMCGKAVKWE